MEQQNDMTSEFNATMNRFYNFFSDLLDEEQNRKDDAGFQDSKKQMSNK
ncbi:MULTISPECIES: hypothetical protein [Ancylomarina]|nr:hypothetical protein [Ancylomarina euxinus]MCZ4693949.1 hypothetical protein [Ancylomarina euxinus]MUP14630.1 hypothetical protein [Ancylomarina euxinus]